MISSVDILENDILEHYPEVLNQLLRDHTTQKNIIWATDNYSNLGNDYNFSKEIQPELITGDYGNLIMPRVQKDKLLQQSRSKDMAEVFTPSWVCNAQNNLIDNAWFDAENIFNTDIDNKDGLNSWLTNLNPIEFPKGKTWKDYIKLKRLEIACGEAPYITSRYDTTTGDFIPIEDRIGLLDRKLRVINENVNTSGEWLKSAQIAYKCTYAYEWQGDSLLLAREAMLMTFIENYRLKFDKEPLLKSLQYVAYIISCNVWQMDGLKGVIPKSCGQKIIKENNLFEQTTRVEKCEGCEKGDIKKHNGIYCIIKDWFVKDKATGKTGRKMKFIDLIKDNK